MLARCVIKSRRAYESAIPVISFSSGKIQDGGNHEGRIIQIYAK